MKKSVKKISAIASAFALAMGMTTAMASVPEVKAADPSVAAVSSKTLFFGTGGRCC